MRRRSRIVLLAALVALAPALAGCENMDFDKLDFLGLSQKKPLPGVRKPLFPEGVPGVSQGIPKEYQKSYVEQQQQQQLNDSALNQPAAGPGANSDAADKKTAAIQPAEKPKPKQKPKPKRTVKHKTKPKPPATTVAPVNSGQTPQQQSSPWPAPGQQQQQQQSSPWPTSGQQQSPWPSTPPTGNFSR
jgi:hypothetical protein